MRIRIWIRNTGLGQSWWQWNSVLARTLVGDFSSSCQHLALTGEHCAVGDSKASYSPGIFKLAYALHNLGSYSNWGVKNRRPSSCTPLRTSYSKCLKKETCNSYTCDLCSILFRPKNLARIGLSTCFSTKEYLYCVYSF